jgi:hypothetical protein
MTALLSQIYPSQFLQRCTPAELARLTSLHEQLTARFDDICWSLATKLSQPSSTDAVAAKAEHLIEQWDEAESEERSTDGLLLAKHHDLGLEIMNIRDDVVGRHADWDDDE